MKAPQMGLVHATSVALGIDHDGPLCGVAILGDSGSGKSQLALSLMERCIYARTRLVADDLTRVEVRGTQLVALLPDHSIGAIEIRGGGIARVTRKSAIPLRFALQIQDRSETRLPAMTEWSPLGASAPSVPQLIWPVRRHHGLVVLIRSLLSGHSLQGGFD